MPSYIELVAGTALLRKQSADGGLANEPNRHFTHGTSSTAWGNGGHGIDSTSDKEVDPNSKGKSVADVQPGGDPRIKPDAGLLEQGTVGPDGKIIKPVKPAVPPAQAPVPAPVDPNAPPVQQAPPVWKPTTGAVWR